MKTTWIKNKTLKWFTSICFHHRSVYMWLNLVFDKVRLEVISNPKKMNACDGWFNVANLISCCSFGHYLVVLHNIQVFYCGCCSCVVALQLLLP
jgi:hypothetical protein